FLVPLTIAAATLRIGFSAVLALLTLGAYTVLLFYYQPFAPFGGAAPAQHAGHGDHSAHVLALETDDPHAHHRMVMTARPPSAGFDLHIFGMWLNFMLSAGLITFFVSRMSGALREQDRQLALQQEQLLQREQVVALGALAAGAAHELGTPLATMTVLAADIEQDLAPDSPLRSDMQLLRRQLGLCRDILHGLREQAGSQSRHMTLADFLGEAVARMELLHPARRFVIDAELPARAVQVPAVLPQVLGNLLDNAAQAARAEVRLACHDEAGECRIDISDDGPGIAPEIAARLGQPFVSSKADGLGIGYFLSHASLTPLGGRIEIEALKQGGTCTRLCLPWSALAGEGA
ncbi:MAG: ATP-binding protein, partial [Moraxellaceae bacterium]